MPPPALGRVLLVEDDDAHASLITFCLEQQPLVGHVDRVLTSLEAMAVLDTAPLPDLVLVDINAPRYDGFDLIRQVRQRPLARRIPMIIVSTSIDEKDVQRAYAMGANAYLAKPLGLAALEDMMGATVRYWLGHRRWLR